MQHVYGLHAPGMERRDVLRAFGFLSEEEAAAAGRAAYRDFLFLRAAARGAAAAKPAVPAGPGAAGSQERSFEEGLEEIL